MSPSRFATLDKCIKTNVPELERNQLGSNFEIFDHQFTDVSLVSLHSRFLNRTLFTIGTFPRPHVFVMLSTPVPTRTTSSFRRASSTRPHTPRS